MALQISLWTSLLLVSLEGCISVEFKVAIYIINFSISNGAKVVVDSKQYETQHTTTGSFYGKKWKVLTSGLHLICQLIACGWEP